MAFGGLTLALEGEESCFEADLRGFDLAALARDALVKPSIGRVFCFEKTMRKGRRGGGFGVTFAKLGDGGIGNDAFEGFIAAEPPGLPRDAENDVLFGGRRGLVRCKISGEKLFEGSERFVLVEKVRA